MYFDLVDGRDDASLGEQVIETVDCEVGNTNSADFSSTKELLHSLVRLGRVDVDQVEDAAFAQREPLSCLSVEGTIFSVSAPNMG
jgi:hypothetical protein